MNKPSLKKSYIYNVIYQIISVLASFITAPYISRVLGSEQIGIYSYVNSIIAYFALFGGLGIASYGMREIARDRDDITKISRTFWSLTLLKVLSFGVSLILYSLVVVFSKEYSILFLILTISLISSMFDISWFFNGLEEFKGISIRNIIMRILGIVAIFIFVKGENALIIYIIVSVLTEVMIIAVSWLFLIGKVKKVKLRDLEVKKHFKSTFVYFVPTIATSVYAMMDKVMLKWIIDENSENGFYEQTKRIIMILETIVFSLNSVMGSRMSLLFKENKSSEMKEGVLKSFNFIFLITFPMVFGICAISSNFVPIFFGPGYDKVAFLIMTMAPIVLIIAVSNILGLQYITPSGQIRKSNKAIIIGAITNLIMNIILIPSMGAYGAIVASIIAELIITIMFVWYSRNFIKFSEIIKYIYKRLIASIIMFVLVLTIGKILPVSVFTVIIQVVVGVVVYLLVLFILVDRLLIQETRNVFNKLKKVVCKICKHKNKEGEKTLEKANVDVKIESADD